MITPPWFRLTAGYSLWNSQPGFNWIKVTEKSGERGLSYSINSKWYTPDETANMICMQAMMDCVYHNQDIHSLNMSLTQQRFSKDFYYMGYFCMGTKRNLTGNKIKYLRSLIRLPVSAFAYGFHINRNRERQEESRDSFQQVDICKWLLRNE